MVMGQEEQEEEQTLMVVMEVMDTKELLLFATQSNTHETQE